MQQHLVGFLFMLLFRILVPQHNQRMQSDKVPAARATLSLLRVVRQQLDMEQLPDKLNSEKNRSVLEYISGLSAHPDVESTWAARLYSNVRHFRRIYGQL